MRWRRSACTLLLLLPLTATAAEPGGANLLEQKRTLLAKLIEARKGAPSADRGRELLAKAERLITAGEIAAAESALDDAMRLVAGTPTQPPPSPEAARQRYGDLLQQLAQYRGAFDGDVRRAGPAVADTLDQGKLDALMREAAVVAGHGEHHRANALLAEALALTEGAVTRARNGQIVVSRLDFATPADEYHYELDRHRSYRMLVDQFLAEGLGGSGARSLAGERMAASAALKSQAEGQASRGDVKAAIATMERATRSLIQALQSMGLPVPE